MDPLRGRTADAGFFTRSEALAAGCTEREIARSARSGAWVRFRHGCYAFGDEWDPLDEIARHRIRSNAVLGSLQGGVALSHVSGMLRHGIDVWGVDLDRVHVTRLDGGPGRIEGDVVHHEGLVTAEDVVRVEGQRVLRAERCVLEAASRAPSETALCLLEAGLRAGAYDRQRLAAQFALMQHWPFVRHLHLPVAMADGRSGSIGESRGLWTFFATGIPAPERQHEVRTSTGELLGTTDWWWPAYGLLGEFDGRIKYGRLLRPGEAPGDVVFREKVREDRLREATGARMLRLTWADLSRPREVRARFDRLAGRAG